MPQKEQPLNHRKKVRLIHTSDTHLGDQWGHPRAAHALAAVVDAVPRLGGDALLIVGDVFDHARVSDAVLEFFLAQVGRLAVPVVVLPGNHDLYDANSLYKRGPFQRKPENLHLLTDHSGGFISFPELTLDFWGRAMRMHCPEFRPLEGMTRQNNDHWLVALAHGHCHEVGDTEVRSSPIRPHEIDAAPCDYLALGHWDRHTDVSQGNIVAVYSGSPLGAYHQEDAGAVLVVDLDPLDGVRFYQAPLNLDESSIPVDMLPLP